MLSGSVPNLQLLILEIPVVDEKSQANFVMGTRTVLKQGPSGSRHIFSKTSVVQLKNFSCVFLEIETPKNG